MSVADSADHKHEIIIVRRNHDDHGREQGKAHRGQCPLQLGNRIRLPCQSIQ